MTFASLVKATLKSFLLKRNLRIARTTDFDSLAQFFSAIKPIVTNHSLIRIGGESDGGYLVPNDLDNIEICFSPGVSVVADFESDLASRGIKCFLADYSVDAPPFHNPSFHFEKKYLGPKEDAIYTRLENWIERNAPNQSEFILQMDIEGSEYDVILDTSAGTLRKFRILVIEFHGLEHLCDKFGFRFINLTFSNLLKDFDIVHIHPNNSFKPITYGKYEIPSTVEFTFLRKDRISSRQPALEYPHKLDRKNCVTNDDFPLPKCWFER